MNTVITTESGVHGHAVPHGVAAFVERHLEAHGVIGHFKLRWGSPLPIRHGAPFVARRVNADKHNVELVLTMRPSDASHVAWLSPDNSNGTPVRGFAYLNDLLTKLQAPPVEPIAPTSPRRPRGDHSKEGDGFLDDADRCHAALAVVGAAGPNVDAVKRALAAKFPDVGANSRVWGQVLGWLARKGLVDADRHSYGGLKAVRLSAHGRAVLPATTTTASTPAPALPAPTKLAVHAAPPSELSRHLSGELARLRREEDALTMAVLERGEKVATLDRELTELRTAQERDERRLATVTARIAAVQLLSTE